VTPQQYTVSSARENSSKQHRFLLPQIPSLSHSLPLYLTHSHSYSHSLIFKNNQRPGQNQVTAGRLKNIVKHSTYTILRNAWHKSLVCNSFAMCKILKILDSKLNFWQMQVAQSIFQFAKIFAKFARFSLKSPILVPGISQYRVFGVLQNSSFTSRDEQN
jgi:hypothetical protein